MTLVAFLGFMMICLFMYLILSKRMSAMVALMLVPIVFGIGLVVMGMADPAKMGGWMKDGVLQAAPTAVMLCFAILYFGTMIDAGLFDPLVNAIKKVVKGDPLRVAVGTCILSAIVSLDGDGATTYLTVCSALLAVHKSVGVHPAMLPTLCALQVGIMNLLPWGGPTGRVLASLNLTSEEVFLPLIPGMVVATVGVLIFAYVWGMRERKRLGWVKSVSATDECTNIPETASTDTLKRPQLFWFNLGLTTVLLYCLMTEVLPLMLLFMIGTGLVLVVNYPKLADQQERVKEHASSALPVISLIFAAGIMMGIMSGTKMVDQMAQSLIAMIPSSMGAHMALFTALLTIPGTFFMTNDAFYFGVLPVLSKAASAYGISTVEIARASLLGPPPHTFSPLTASTWLLVGMSGVSMADLQKYGLIPAIMITLIFIATALVLGLFPF
ncbi:CitMHS family transporter [Acetonema longum]|nr:citrate:proton symporter [Acetonema longum]